MTKKEIENKIKRIPGHSPQKLTSFELLFTAGEYEKFRLTDLIEQANNVNLSAEEQDKLKKHFASFESDLCPHDKSSWFQSPPTVR